MQWDSGEIGLIKNHTTGKNRMAAVSEMCEKKQFFDWGGGALLKS